MSHLFRGALTFLSPGKYQSRHQQWLYALHPSDRELELINKEIVELSTSFHPFDIFKTLKLRRKRAALLLLMDEAMRV